jgi:hypothetical protein
LLVLSVVIWLSLIVVTGQVLFGLAMMAAGTAFLGYNSREQACSR